MSCSKEEVPVYEDLMDLCGITGQDSSKDYSKYNFSTKRKQKETKSFSKSFAAVDINIDEDTKQQNHKNDNFISPSKFVNKEKSLNCTTETKSTQSSISSTPVLIVSDTSTGINNFLIESNQLLPSHLAKRTLTAAKPIKCNRISQIADGSIGSHATLFHNTSSDTGIETDSDSTLFLPLQVPVCDSAYGSSMESRSETLSPSIYCNAERTISRHNSENEPVSPLDTPAEPCDSLSVCFPSTSLFSSTSSIASDCIGENESHDSETLQVEQEHRKLSSSSSISLRSSTSIIEESEEDIASGDDFSFRHETSRRNSKIKAQKSWMKLRMAIWSPFMQSYKKKYPWVQLAGHAGSFQPGEEGCILKKYVEREANCLEGFKNDSELHDFAPVYHGIVMRKNEKYTRMQDLLLQFDCPSIMDCKMGIRTYLEDELTKAKVNPCLRPDMYQKMIEISPEEPSLEERAQKAVTKPRYMQWREKVSSTSTLGFRIEGIKKSGRDPSKDFKLTKTSEDVSAAFRSFIDGNLTVLKKYLERLKVLRTTLENSSFFRSHEVIGSSLLFVHDASGLANVWMIDFGKTTKLPESIKLNHRGQWMEGNREDGYLLGMDNMIDIFDQIYNRLCENAPPDANIPTFDIISPVDGVQEE